MTIHARIGKKSGASKASANSGMNNNQRIGASFGNIDKRSPLYGQVQGVVVTRVKRGEAADEAGLQPGDVIVAIKHRPIRNLVEFKQTLAVDKGQTVLLTVRRGNSIFFTTLSIP